MNGVSMRFGKVDYSTASTMLPAMMRGTNQGFKLEAMDVLTREMKAGEADTEDTTKQIRHFEDALIIGIKLLVLNRTPKSIARELDDLTGKLEACRDYVAPRRVWKTILDTLVRSWEELS